MVAYEGNVEFSRKGQGILKGLKSGLAGEGIRTVAAISHSPDSVVYVSDDGRKVIPFYLNANESVVVENEHVLAFEHNVEWEVIRTKSAGAFSSAGLFSLKFKGPGFLAVSCEFDPLVLQVRPDRPVVTDPQNTVLWSGTLTPALKTDIKVKAVFGRSSGEEFQMSFEGNGYVLISCVTPPIKHQ
jgi:uncharacterized protein (AIM24 family)